MIQAVRNFVKAYQEGKEAETERIRQLVSERWDEIHNDPDSPVAGNPQGDVTVTEFFDYR
ncbi:MAG: hypothetical protein ACE5JS_11250 [Nitrospinota bacterium]